MNACMSCPLGQLSCHLEKLAQLVSLQKLTEICHNSQLKGKMLKFLFNKNGHDSWGHEQGGMHIFQENQFENSAWCIYQIFLRQSQAIYEPLNIHDLMAVIKIMAINKVVKVNTLVLYNGSNFYNLFISFWASSVEEKNINIANLFWNSYKNSSKPK